jgi:hypothetical protein
MQQSLFNAPGLVGQVVPTQLSCAIGPAYHRPAKID